MPWGAVAGGIASAVVGSALAPSGGGGGGTAGGSAPPVYIPKDQAGQDQNFLNNYNAYQTQINNQQGVTSPYNQQLLQGQFNNPNAAFAQNGAAMATNDYYTNANNAGAFNNQNYAYAGQQMNNATQANQLYQSGLSNVQNSSGALYGSANQSNSTYADLMNYQKGQLGNISKSQNNLYGAGNQVLQTSQDPQNALYNRTAGQVTDQTRAGEYARGIQSSPYGASVEANAMSNFNIDWQNQQLARQTQGLQAAQGAYGSAQGLGNSYTGAVAGLQAGQNEQYAGLTNAAQNQYTNYIGSMNQSNASNTSNINNSQQNAFGLGQQVAGAVQTGGMLGYNTDQAIYNGQNSAIGNYNNNNQTYLSGLNQLQSNSLGYMNFGQGAQSLGYNQNMQNNQASQAALSAISGPVGNAVKNSNWSNLFGGSSDTSWNTGVNGYGDYDYFG